MNVEATEKEIVTIGFNRYLKARWRMLVPLPICALTALLIASILLPDSWVWWLRAVTLFPLLVLFFWGYYKLFALPTKAGKHFLEEVKAQSGM